MLETESRKTMEDPTLSPLAQKGCELYESRLRALLEPGHSGKAVAIHVATGDYEVARTHSQAARALLERHPPDGGIVTLTIGPPTEADLRLATRVVAGQKQ
jgi:hypothetical protein